jgi:hypothetical protein
MDYKERNKRLNDLFKYDATRGQAWEMLAALEEPLVRALSSESGPVRQGWVINAMDGMRERSWYCNACCRKQVRLLRGTGLRVRKSKVENPLRPMPCSGCTEVWVETSIHPTQEDLTRLLQRGKATPRMDARWILPMRLDPTCRKDAAFPYVGSSWMVGRIPHRAFAKKSNWTYSLKWLRLAEKWGEGRDIQ